MPAPHQEYLRYLSESPRPIRELAKQTAALREPYNAAVMALKRFHSCDVSALLAALSPYIQLQTLKIDWAHSNLETIAVLRQWIEQLENTLSEQHMESGCGICYGPEYTTSYDHV